jgi:solute carrier family 25 protein 39/40
MAVRKEEDDPHIRRQTQNMSSVQVQFIASSGASLISAVLLTPLDMIKTRLQTLQSSGGAEFGRSMRGVCSYFPTFTGGSPSLSRLPIHDQLCYLCGRELQPAGASKCLELQWHRRPVLTSAWERTAHPEQRATLIKVTREIVKYEGISALWKGTGPALVMAVPQVGIYLNTYDYVKKRLLMDGHSLTLASILSGSIARTTSVIITSPLELVRMRLQADVVMRLPAAHEHAGPASRSTGAASWFAIVSDAVSSRGGVRALWQGLGPTLWRDVPFSAVYWVVVERTRAKFLSVSLFLMVFFFFFGQSHLLVQDIFEGVYPLTCAMMKQEAPPAGEYSADSNSTMRANMIAGVTGGAAASLVTHPFDVIKTRSQVHQGEYPAGTFEIGKKVMQDGGGLSALWRGLVRTAHAPLSLDLSLPLSCTDVHGPLSRSEIARRGCVACQNQSLGS